MDRLSSLACEKSVKGYVHEMTSQFSFVPNLALNARELIAYEIYDD